MIFVLRHIFFHKPSKIRLGLVNLSRPTGGNQVKMSSDQNCVFCNVIRENDRSKIIYEDDEVVVFPDIKPAAPYHYLVVPKAHVPNPKSLGPEHKALVERMIEVAKKIIGEKGCELSNASFGFHWPPFNSINHLHLHAIAPTCEMGFIARLVFRPNSWWFVSRNLDSPKVKVPGKMF